jgi:uroporphyrinogen decarboxylase
MADKKLLRALAGEAVWPPPIWLMRQAGRYLPEYRAVRDRAGGFIALCTTPELASEVTLQPVRRFGMDGAILFSDILMIPWALGHELRFAEGEGPVLPPLRTAADLDRLELAQVPEAIKPILETVRLTRAALGDTATLIGFAGGPFTVACYMIEGGGSKNFGHVRAMAYGEPGLFVRLMEMVTAATITYLSAQIDAGAEVVMLFDSWAGILSPSLFAAHVVAPSRRIVAELASRHPGIRVIGFPRLAGVQIAGYARETGVSAVAMDTAADPAVLRGMLPERLALQGNLDPAALIAGGAALANETDTLLQAMRGHPFVFNLGHGIEPHTPPAHVAALVEQVRHA